MKYFFFILGAFLLLSSCEKWDDYYYNMDTPPGLTLYKDGLLYTDSIDSIKVNTILTLTYKITSERAQRLQISSSGHLDTLVFLDDHTLTFKGLSAGICQITCSVKDAYLKSEERRLNFIIFDNLPPVASFTYIPISNLSSHEIEFDASSSYDKDARFGGKVVEYDFTMDNTVNFQTTNGVVDFSFNSAGTKQVKLRVKDNDNTWSGYLIKNITVN
ncbi:MAG: hypothetical protein Q8907_00160 [Bacteroidota bacterium]|nr:hypothetical protein [Bacteroidota bacterium]